MTIHGLDYRPGPYQPTGPWRRLWPLAALEFRGLFRTVWGIVLYGICCVPAVFRLMFLLVYLGVIAFGGPMRGAGDHTPRELRGFLPTSVEFYVDQVVAPDQGMFVFLLLTAFTTARVIAKDRATNALELYWTRGIAPLGYFAAKWFGSFLLVATLTVVAPVLLWLVGVLLAEDWSFAEATVRFLPGVIAGLLVFTVTLSTICVLVSAIAGAANLAMILWCLLIGGGTAFAHVGSALVGRDVTECLSVWDAAATLARACAGVPQAASPACAGALVAGVVLVLGVVCVRRMRVTEAVA